MRLAINLTQELFTESAATMNAASQSRSAMGLPLGFGVKRHHKRKGTLAHKHLLLLLLVVGCWLLVVVGCWLFVVGCWLLVVGCWLLVVVCCLLFVVCCLLFVVSCGCDCFVCISLQRSHCFPHPAQPDSRLVRLVFLTTENANSTAFRIHDISSILVDNVEPVGFIKVPQNFWIAPACLMILPSALGLKIVIAPRTAPFFTDKNRCCCTQG